MALTGPWGTFIHIPKCGGSSMRKALQDHWGEGEEVGNGHTVPGQYKDAWLLIRHPAYWIRSMWNWRRKYGWKIHDVGAKEWTQIQLWVDWGRKYEWDRFFEEYIADHPGLVYKCFAQYFRDDIRVFRLERLDELYDYLGEQFEIPHVNCQALSPKYEMNGTQIGLVEKNEPDLMALYSTNGGYR